PADSDSYLFKTSSSHQRRRKSPTSSICLPITPIRPRSQPNGGHSNRQDYFSFSPLHGFSPNYGLLCVFRKVATDSAKWPLAPLLTWRRISTGGGAHGVLLFYCSHPNLIAPAAH